jgi:hypothetical protein
MELENKKILKSNKALYNDLEALKQRVASLEDEKIRSLATHNELKSDANLKKYEVISLREELDQKTEEVISLREEPDEKTEKEKKRKEENHKLELACLLNKLHHE